MADTADYYQAPTPAPELKQLNFLVGRWQTKGNFKASEYGEAGTVEGEHSFEWFNEFFLKHSWKEALGSGVEYIGYEDARKSFYTHYFDNNGPYDEEGSTYEGEMRGKSYVQCGPARIIYTPSEDGATMKVTAEMSSKQQRRQGLDAPDTDWQDWLEVTYTKVS